jgi:hypothetical protein
MPVTALALLLASSAFGFNPLETKVTVSAPPGLEFHAICKAAKIPCAIELDAAAAGDPHGRAVFRADDAPVPQAMNLAIRRYSGHRWRFRKGVLYVTPNKPDPATPLDRPLGRAKFSESLDSLRDEFGASAGFCAAPRGDAVGPKPEAAGKLSFRVEDATPRAVLNAFVFRQGLAGWVVARTPSSGGGALFCLDLVAYDR